MMMSAYVGDRLWTGKPPRMNQAPRPTQPEPALCAGWNEYLATDGGSKQAYHVTHQPVHVVSHCSLNAWLGTG